MDTGGCDASSCHGGNESFSCTHTHELEEGIGGGEQLLHCHHTHTYARPSSSNVKAKERNAKAAQRYRQRRKEDRQRTAELLRQLREQNDALANENVRLRAENAQLRAAHSTETHMLDASEPHALFDDVDTSFGNSHLSL